MAILGVEKFKVQKLIQEGQKLVSPLTQSVAVDGVVCIACMCHTKNACHAAEGALPPRVHRVACQGPGASAARAPRPLMRLGVGHRDTPGSRYREGMNPKYAAVG